jgi:chemotaxis protein MotB
LEGHTETKVEAGVESHNQWDLSTERANAARRKLVQNGVSAAQLCKISGYADTVPMPELPPSSEANRRVTVLLRLKESLANLSASGTGTSQ